MARSHATDVHSAPAAWVIIPRNALLQANIVRSKGSGDKSGMDLRIWAPFRGPICKLPTCKFTHARGVSKFTNKMGLFNGVCRITDHTCTLLRVLPLKGICNKTVHTGMDAGNCTPKSTSAPCMQLLQLSNEWNSAPPTESRHEQCVLRIYEELRKDSGSNALYQFHFNLPASYE